MILLISSQITALSLDNSKLLIAHQKNSIDEIKNSKNSDMIEIDLRKTKDNIYIAHHNSKYKNTPINKLNYSSLPKSIPKIETILKKYNKTKFNIELKETGYELEATNFILNLTKKSNILITSKHFSSLLEIKKEHNDLTLGLIITKDNIPKFISKYIKSRFAPDSLIKKAAKENFLILPDYRFINNNFLASAKKHNTKIIIWTVNNPKSIEKYLEHEQVAGIITDKDF